MKFTDPSGHDPDPLEKAWFGQIVHKEVQTMFKATFGKFASVEVRLPSAKRVDMILTLGKMRQVYELKPMSNSPRGNIEYNQKAKAQLDGYVNELNEIAQQTKSGILAVKGTVWNPNGITLPHPTDPKKELVLYTYYETDPGMVYYGERSNKKALEMEMQESMQKEMDRFEHNLNIIRNIFMPGRSPLGIPIPVP